MIELKNVTKKYDKTIFEHFNFSIPDNKVTCILGESGVGKTTLLKMLAGMTTYTGTILGIKEVSYIFQEDRLIPNLTVLKNLKLICPSASEEEIKAVLAIFKIEDKMSYYPRQLSGGEAKRVSMARAFLYDAPVLLLDEPFSSLDLSLKLELIQYLSEYLSKNPKTVVFVTHDIDETLLLGNDVWILKNGEMKHALTLTDGFPRKLESVMDLHMELMNQLLKLD